MQYSNAAALRASSMLAPPTLWAGATIQYCWRSCSCSAEQQTMSTIAVMHSNTAVQEHSSTTNSTCCSCCCGAGNDAHSLSLLHIGTAVQQHSSTTSSTCCSCCVVLLTMHTAYLSHPPRQASSQHSLVEHQSFLYSTSVQQHMSHEHCTAAQQHSSTAALQHCSTAAL